MHLAAYEATDSQRAPAYSSPSSTRSTVVLRALAARVLLDTSGGLTRHRFPCWILSNLRMASSKFSNSLWSCCQNFTQIHDTRLFRIYLEYDAITRRPKRQQNVRNYSTPSLRRLASLLRRITLSTDNSF